MHQNLLLDDYLFDQYNYAIPTGEYNPRYERIDIYFDEGEGPLANAIDHTVNKQEAIR